MFSMDGDFGPLLELIELHRMYGLLLVMDVPWTVGDHCDVGVIGLTKCSGTHGLLPCFDTFLLVSIQRETICVHPLDFMIWPQVKGKCTNLATKATPTRIAIDGDRCSIDPSSPVCYSHFTATIMSSAVFASMRLNATNQSYLPVPITLATAYKMQHGDNLKLKTSHGLKIKIKIKEVASTLMPSRSKACVMILNRQGLIRCPVKTPSNSSSANKRSPDPSGQLTRASTFDHASSSKSVPFLRNGTVTKENLADTSFCHQIKLTAELKSYIKEIADCLEESNKFYVVRMNRTFMEQDRVYFATEFSKKYIVNLVRGKTANIRVQIAGRPSTT
uniref:Uncharacterized protein n=1 Tax=Oryza barthii TaxID=65489 RepID=A0A0D3H699_9ORYZ